MTEEQEQEFNNLISEALNIQVFSYNSTVTDEVFGVMKCIAKDRPAYNTAIARAMKLKESHVELIQYLLCNNDHAEYGTSPRGCWLTEKGEKLYEQLSVLADEGGE
jgi:hypothetical protein